MALLQHSHIAQCPQPVERSPVGGGLLARQQAGRMQHEGAGAHRQHGLRMAGLRRHKIEQHRVAHLAERALSTGYLQVVQRRAVGKRHMRVDRQALGTAHRPGVLRHDQAGRGPFGHLAPHGEHLPRAHKSSSSTSSKTRIPKFILKPLCWMEWGRAQWGAAWSTLPSPGIVARRCGGRWGCKIVGCQPRSDTVGLPLTIFLPLRIRAVALLWGGLSFSAVGDQLYAVALSWIAVELLGANAGYLSALQALTLLVAALSVGKWADGCSPRAAMMGADLMRAAVLLLMVSGWWLAGRPQTWMLVLAILVLAVGQAVFQPALHSWLPTLVKPAQWLPAANGLFDATDRSARLIGPGLVALAAGSLPVMHFFTIDALSFLGSAAALMWIAKSHRPGGVNTGVEAGRLWESVARGWVAIQRHPVLSYALASTGINNGAWYATFYLGLPLMLADPASGDTTLKGIGAYGLVIACYGCTNLASTVFFGSRALPARPQFQ